MPDLHKLPLAPLCGIVFDVDGTLVSDDLHRQKHNHVLALSGLADIEITLQEWPQIRGLSDIDTHAYHKARAHKNGLSSAKLPPEDDYIIAANDFFFSHLQELELREGAGEVLKTARACGLLAGVATNADQHETDLKLAAVGLSGEFLSFSCLDGTIAPKPAPDLFTQAVAQLGWLAGRIFAPDEVVVIEDSVTGVAAALRAGCWVIWWRPDGANHRLPDGSGPLDKLIIMDSHKEIVDFLQVATQSKVCCHEDRLIG